MTSHSGASAMKGHSGASAMNGGALTAHIRPMRGKGPYICSIHTHTTLCDGKGTPEEMVSAAYEQGVRYYGFSGHSPTRSAYDTDCVMRAEDLREYRTRVFQLRTEYTGRMEILFGIELDSLSDLSPDGFDYWIGSVHHILDAQGRDFPVDYSRETFLTGLSEIFHGDIDALTTAYYHAVGTMAERGPTVLGHMDLLTKFNEGNGVFDETSPFYRRAALEALHRVEGSVTLLEINTGAMSRGYRTTPYPARFILEEWRRMGGRIIITADAHSPEAIVYGYGEAVELARSAGFTDSTILTLHGVETVSL